jgi:hypothetical protein
MATASPICELRFNFAPLFQPLTQNDFATVPTAFP